MSIFKFLPSSCDDYDKIHMSSYDFHYATIRESSDGKPNLYAWQHRDYGVFVENTTANSAEEFLEQTRNAAQDPSNKDAQGTLALAELFGVKIGPATPLSKLPNGVYFDKMDVKMKAMRQNLNTCIQNTIIAKRTNKPETYQKLLQQYERLVSALAISDIAVEDIERTEKAKNEKALSVK